MLLLRHSSCEDDLRKRIRQGQTRIAAPTWSHFVISSSCFDGFKGKKGLAFIELSRHFKQSDALALLCNSSALSKCQSIPRSDAACSGPLRKSTQTGTTAPISKRYARVLPQLYAKICEATCIFEQPLSSLLKLCVHHKVRTVCTTNAPSKSFLFPDVKWSL